MKFAVTIVSPPSYPHSAAFLEVAQTIHWGLQKLGFDSILTTEGKLTGRQHIVLGCNLLPAHAIPLSETAILYNLEQIYDDSPWLTNGQLDYFKKYRVWDYNPSNVAAFQKFGVAVEHVLPIGYAQELSRITPVAQRDIDVLFIGAINDRRREILGQIYSRGLKLMVGTNVYGPKRDELIARAKIILNTHLYEAKIFEIVRISYLLANRCTVLSEFSSDPHTDAEFAAGVAFARYEDLATHASRLLASPAERERIATKGYELMRSRAIETYLAQASDKLLGRVAAR